MVDGGHVQERIQYGYAKAAQKIGAPFFLFRSATPFMPLKHDNLIGIINSSSNVSWDYMKQQRYGKAVWNLVIETRQTQPIYAQPGDYLVPAVGYYFNLGGYNNYETSFYSSNDSFDSSACSCLCSANAYGTNLDIYSQGFFEDKLTYFVAATEFLLPPLGVNVNRIIKIIRPTQPIGDGYQGYSQYLPETSELIASGMPASVLESGSPDRPPTALPTDERDPRWIILIPNLDLVVRVTDIIIDDLNQEYVVTENELTFLGWRLLAEQVVNSR